MPFSKHFMQLSGLTIKGNYLLIKPDEDFSTYQFGGKETEILVSRASDTASQHFSVTGEVIKAPPYLVFNGEKIVSMRRNYGYNDETIEREVNELKKNSVLYDVPVEVRPGEHVMFNYQQYFDANKNGRYFTCDGDRYYLIRYDESVCSMLPESKNKIHKMLNGFLLIEPLKLPLQEDGGMKYYERNGLRSVYMGNGYAISKKFAFAKVVMTGANVRGYREWPGVHDTAVPYLNIDWESIKFPEISLEDYIKRFRETGFMIIESHEKATITQLEMIICYDPRYATNVEYDLHRTLTENKSYRIHRKDIWFVTDASTFDIHSIIHNFVK